VPVTWEEGTWAAWLYDLLHSLHLRSPLDAIKELQQELQNHVVSKVGPDTESGELLFEFTGSIRSQVLNLTWL
jgi:hypothetical protein